MRSLLVLAFFAFATAGCLGVDSPDGALKCADNPARVCPEGFYCYVGDNTCWRFGHFPDLSFPPPPVQQPSFDFSFPVEDMSVDAGVPDDLSQPDDLSSVDGASQTD
jgi:hypothetical protein